MNFEILSCGLRPPRFFPESYHFPGVGKVRSLHYKHTIVENAYVQSQENEIKHDYKNGSDLEDLLKWSWGSPGFLGPHFGNCCFIPRAVHIQSIHQLFRQNHLDNYSCCNFYSLHIY